MKLRNPYDRQVRISQVFLFVSLAIFMMSFYGANQGISVSYPLLYISAIILLCSLIFYGLYRRCRKWAEQALEMNEYLGTLHYGEKIRSEMNEEQRADKTLKRGCSGGFWLLFALIGGIFYFVGPSEEMGTFFWVLFFVGAFIFLTVYLVSGIEAKKMIPSETHFFTLGFSEGTTSVVFDGHYVQFLKAQWNKEVKNNTKLLIYYSMPMGRYFRRTEILKEFSVEGSEEQIAMNILNSINHR